MVHLQELHEKYADKGLRVFVISMHPDAEQARRLTKDLGVTYPVFNGHDSDFGRQYAYG